MFRLSSMPNTLRDIRPSSPPFSPWRGSCVEQLNSHRNRFIVRCHQHNLIPLSPSLTHRVVVSARNNHHNGSPGSYSKHWNAKSSYLHIPPFLLNVARPPTVDLKRKTKIALYVVFNAIPYVEGRMSSLAFRRFALFFPPHADYEEGVLKCIRNWTD